MNLLTLALIVALLLVALLMYACGSLWLDMRFWRTECSQMTPYIEQLEMENIKLLAWAGAVSRGEATPEPKDTDEVR